MKSPETLVRRHVKTLRPYTAARDIYGSKDLLFLDANESPYPPEAASGQAELHRYPDPRCTTLRDRLAGWLDVRSEQLWIGNGSDEALDLLLRTFVEPGQPVVICGPTYGMYEISAGAHNAAVRPAALDASFDLDVDATLAAAAGAKLIFTCSPNNPTGNRLTVGRIERLAASFAGLIVVDEAYVEFSATPSLIPLARERRNIIILRTFSKAWGLAAARVGYFVADRDVVEYVDRLNLPYPLNALSAAVAAAALGNVESMRERVTAIVRERQRLAERLAALGVEVFPSDANFLLLRLPQARRVYRRMAEKHGIVLRDRSDVPRLEDCLRMTVGRPADTDRVCTALEAVLKGRER